MSESTTPATPAPQRRFGCLHVFLFVTIAVLVTAVVAFFVVRAYFFPRAFQPVTLNAREEAALQTKIARLDARAPAAAPAAPAGQVRSSEPADVGQTIRITAKELNALLAKNTDLADKARVDLSPGLLRAALRIPVDPDVPVLGGKILRARAEASFRYDSGRPVVMLTDVTVMGISIPNAWLGGLKNVDLIQEANGSSGFWKAFRDGVDDLRIEDGAIVIRLKK